MYSIRSYVVSDLAELAGQLRGKWRGTCIYSYVHLDLLYLSIEEGGDERMVPVVHRQMFILQYAMRLKQIENNKDMEFDDANGSAHSGSRSFGDFQASFYEGRQSGSSIGHVMEVKPENNLEEYGPSLSSLESMGDSQTSISEA